MYLVNFFYVFNKIIKSNIVCKMYENRKKKTNFIYENLLYKITKKVINNYQFLFSNLFLFSIN